MSKYIVVLISLLWPLSVQAWGPLGHKTLCDIAWRNSSSEMRQQLGKAAKRMGYKTFAQSCVWPDEVRNKPRYQALKSLHYVNLKRTDTSTSKAQCLSGLYNTQKPQCIITAIPYYQARIGDLSLSRRQRDEALLFMSHFVGDIHQPLHVSYKDDLGGNRRRVVFQGRVLPLHQLWDTHILYCGKTTRWSVLGKYLSHQIDGESIGSNHDILSWAEESFKLTRTIYQNLPQFLPADYCQRYYPLAEQRLRLAGMRLSQLLAQALAPQ